MLPNPPSTIIPKFYYGNLASIPSAAQGTFFPAGVVGFDKAGQIPTTYNWNLTIQRELPKAILFDIAYVGAATNHLLYRINQNAIPLGAAWLPQNQDPLVANPKFDGTTSNQPNFYRPYVGYTNTTDYGFGANTNYHSLQVSAHRRFGKDLTFGVAYTWSKVMGILNDDGGTVTPFNARVADYGPLNYDHTHVLVFNYVYSLPKFIRANSTAGKVGGAITNNWQVSGITTMMTGQPDSIVNTSNNAGFSIDGVGNINERYTGSPDVAPRVTLKGSPSYPKSLNSWVDPSVFALPPVKGSQGFDSSRYQIRRPGDHNWDISVFKNFPMFSERSYLQLRVEMFNAWNIARFNDFNRQIAFSQDGTIKNLPTALGGTGGRFGFGALTGTADPRRIQLAAKFYF